MEIVTHKGGSEQGTTRLRRIMDEHESRFQLADLFGIPHAMVRTAAAGDQSVEVKGLATEGDKWLNSSVRQQLSDRKQPKSERQKYEANSILAWFLRDGTDVDAYVESSRQHSDHSYGTMFECMLQLAPDSLREAIVSTYMAWVAERFGSEFDRLDVQLDPESAAEVWRWDTGEVIDEAALRTALAQMHQAFLSSRLGDVQEELSVMATIAVTAARPVATPLSPEWMQQEADSLAENDASIAAKQQRETQERLMALQEQEKERRRASSASGKKAKALFLAKDEPGPKQQLEQALQLKWGSGVRVSHVLDRPGGSVHLSPFICTVTVRPPSGVAQSFVGEPSIAKKQAERNGFWAALRLFASST